MSATHPKDDAGRNSRMAADAWLAHVPVPRNQVHAIPAELGASAPDALAVLDAPKPPPQRVSLSAARLSRTRELLFLVEGESKRDAVKRWRAGAGVT